MSRPDGPAAARTVSMILAGVMGVQSLAGLAFPGLYRDTGYVLGTWFGNDLVTLALGVPLLAVGVVLDRRRRFAQEARSGMRESTAGRNRVGWARLLWLGMLGYAAYNYAFYLLGATLNAFFPLYVLGVVLAVAGLILLLAATDPRRIRSSFAAATPVRAVGGYYVMVAVLLAVVWVGMWAAHVFAGRDVPAGDPAAFRLVAALDLTLMVPALGIGGALLWRRRPWGYVLASLAGIQGSLYLLILALNTGLFILRGDAQWPGELPVWGGLWVATTVATAILLRSAREGLGREEPGRKSALRAGSYLYR